MELEQAAMRGSRSDMVGSCRLRKEGYRTTITAGMLSMLGFFVNSRRCLCPNPTLPFVSICRMSCCRRCGFTGNFGTTFPLALTTRYVNLLHLDCIHPSLR